MVPNARMAKLAAMARALKKNKPDPEEANEPPMMESSEMEKPPMMAGR